MLTNKAYDTLKLIALVAAPVIVFAVSVMSALNVPNMEVITSILAAFETLLGALVEIARRYYNKNNGEGIEG